MAHHYECSRSVVNVSFEFARRNPKALDVADPADPEAKRNPAC